MSDISIHAHYWPTMLMLAGIAVESVLVALMFYLGDRWARSSSNRGAP